MGNKTEAEKRQLHDLHMGNIKHNHCNTKIYRVWCTMWQRCTNPKAHLYSNYGGRGISVCERWNNFEAFLEDMGERPTNKHTIDRINNDKTLTVSDWAKQTKLAYNTILNRLLRNWPIEKTLTTPARKICHSH